MGHKINREADLLKALKRLVACPDVNEDMLSPETIAALDRARELILRIETEDAIKNNFGEIQLLQSRMKILKNGIKHEGVYYRASYSDGALINYPTGTITVYATSSKGLPKALNPQNDSDPRSDYSESDRARIVPADPLHKEFIRFV